MILTVAFFATSKRFVLSIIIICSWLPAWLIFLLRTIRKDSLVSFKKKRSKAGEVFPRSTAFSFSEVAFLT